MLNSTTVGATGSYACGDEASTSRETLMQALSMKHETEIWIETLSLMEVSPLRAVNICDIGSNPIGCTKNKQKIKILMKKLIINK